MPPTPPRKTTSRKTAAVVPGKKPAVVEPAPEAPKVARKSAPAKPKAPARKPASESTIAAGTTPVAAVAAEPRRKAPARIHAAPATLSPAERHRLVEVAAYYIAERRGFSGGSHHDDWLQAEREVDAMIAAGKFDA